MGLSAVIEGAPVLSNAESQQPKKLGIQFIAVTQEIAEATKIGKVGGVIVANVASNSVAAQAGIVLGDIVLTFNGKSISSVEDLQIAVPLVPLAAKVPIRLWRAGSEIDVIAQF